MVILRLKIRFESCQRECLFHRGRSRRSFFTNLYKSVAIMTTGLFHPFSALRRKSQQKAKIRGQNNTDQITR